jgi:hypothetical protein
MEAPNDLPGILSDYFVEFKNRVREDGTQPNYRLLPNSYQHFKKAAEICESLEAEPYLYMLAVFDGQDPINIRPEFTHAKNVVEKYERVMSRNSILGFNDILKLNTEYLEVQRKLGFKDEDILLTKWIPFTAWFRFIMFPAKADPQKLKTLKAKFQLEAQGQYSKKLAAFLTAKGFDPNKIL